MGAASLLVSVAFPERCQSCREQHSYWASERSMRPCGRSDVLAGLDCMFKPE